jgi:hypothetical protein
MLTFRNALSGPVLIRDMSKRQLPLRHGHFAGILSDVFRDAAFDMDQVFRTNAVGCQHGSPARTK